MSSTGSTRASGLLHTGLGQGSGTGDFLTRDGRLPKQDTIVLPSPKCNQSSSLQATERVHFLAVWDKWIMVGLQKRIFKCSWFFLPFSVGVCHAKGEALVLFLFVH